MGVDSNLRSVFNRLSFLNSWLPKAEPFHHNAFPDVATSFLQLFPRWDPSHPLPFDGRPQQNLLDLLSL